jgi:hypothetical protein
VCLFYRYRVLVLDLRGMAIAYRVPGAVPGAVSPALEPEAAALLLPDDSIFRFTVASWLSSNIIIS